MKRVKRILAVAVASIMLCGAVITVGAHVHAYSNTKTVCYNSFSRNTHPYITGVKTYTSGKVEYQYGTCQVVEYRYKDFYECACGDYFYDPPYSKAWHSACGIGWE